jgi:uroporphyrinogen decarboxylase
MNSREKVKAIFDLKSTGNVGFWTGNPLYETELIYLSKLGFSNREDLFKYLNDDCRWLPADSAYKHPEGKQAFDPFYSKDKKSLGDGGYFANCESIKEVDKYPWPDPDYLDFTEVRKQIIENKDKAVFTGMWSPFFHIMCDFFGMENYFVKMYTDPDIIEAVTAHIIDFLCEANGRLFREIGDEADTFFFGNDFGSQIDLLVSPEAFKKFIMPGFKRLIDVAKRYDKKVLWNIQKRWSRSCYKFLL